MNQYSGGDDLFDFDSELADPDQSTVEEYDPTVWDDFYKTIKGDLEQDSAPIGNGAGTNENTDVKTNENTDGETNNPDGAMNENPDGETSAPGLTIQPDNQFQEATPPTASVPDDFDFNLDFDDVEFQKAMASTFPDMGAVDFTQPYGNDFNGAPKPAVPALGAIGFTQAFDHESQGASASAPTFPAIDAIDLTQSYANDFQGGLGSSVPTLDAYGYSRPSNTQPQPFSPFPLLDQGMLQNIQPVRSGTEPGENYDPELNLWYNNAVPGTHGAHYNNKIGWYHPVQLGHSAGHAYGRPDLLPVIPPPQHHHVNPYSYALPTSQATTMIPPTPRTPKLTPTAPSKQPTDNQIHKKGSVVQTCVCHVENGSEKIPRPRNKFMFYRMAHLARIRAQEKEAGRPSDMCAVSRAAGKEWQRRTHSIDALYTRLAEEEKQQHRLKYPNYVYNPDRGQNDHVGFGKEGCTCGAYETNMDAARRRQQASTPTFPETPADNAQAPPIFGVGVHAGGYALPLHTRPQFQPVSAWGYQQLPQYFLQSAQYFPPQLPFPPGQRFQQPQQPQQQLQPQQQQGPKPKAQTQAAQQQESKPKRKARAKTAKQPAPKRRSTRQTRNNPSLYIEIDADQPATADDEEEEEQGLSLKSFPKSTKPKNLALQIPKSTQPAPGQMRDPAAGFTAEDLVNASCEPQGLFEDLSFGSGSSGKESGAAPASGHRGRRNSRLTGRM